MEKVVIRSFKQLVEEAREMSLEGKDMLEYVESKKRLDLEVNEKLREEEEIKALMEKEAEERKTLMEKEAEERKAIREAQEREKIREAEEREKIRQYELEKLRLTQNNETQPSHTKQLDKNLKSMTEDDDLTYYLELFETTAIASGISKEKWSLHLTHKLNTKLRDFMIQMKYINNSDYEFVKTELLKQAQHTEEACRTRWHNLQPKSDDLKAFYVALQKHFDNWLRTSRTPSTVEGLTDLILYDRILSVLSDAALSDVVLRQPGTATQALEYIDQYRDAT